jgi:hypothetical protein
VANMTLSFLPRVTGGGLLLLAHTDRPPNDAEWEQYIAELAKHDPRQLRSLTFTDGGGPSAAQRKQVNDYLAGQASPCAVVTSSSMVRGLVSALGWFNAQIKTYSPRDLDAALKHLAVTADEAPRVRREIQLLRTRLDHAGLKCILAD